MIAIVDYGMGNLFSIYNALVHIKAETVIVREPSALSGADGIVVPGVGSFGRCMEKLSPYKGALHEALVRGTPILGICVGMQVLFDCSQESPEVPGLGWISGDVLRLPDGVMVPQMGWNELTLEKGSELFDGIADGDLFYFVHSYHCVPREREVVAATTEHGTKITAAVVRDNLVATQFHPEKSGRKGLRILENYVRSTTC